MLHTLTLMLALASPDAGVHVKPKTALPAKTAPTPAPKPKAAPPTASKPTTYKAGAWTRTWRRGRVTLEESGELLVDIVIQAPDGSWIERQTVRVPPDGSAPANQHGMKLADKTPWALQQALLELLKQVDAMVNAAAQNGKLNR